MRTSESGTREFSRLGEQSTQFSQLAAFRGWDANLTAAARPSMSKVRRLRPNFFPCLDISAQLGRQIGSADFQGGVAPVVVISHGFWQQHLAADPGIVGRAHCS